ncbi:MAG: hypothetical protein ABI721_03025 [Candidatus Dojkabacteria bacterium]
MAVFNIPVIDGLGAVGTGSHTGEEYISFKRSIERVELVKNFFHKLAL